MGNPSWGIHAFNSASVAVRNSVAQDNGGGFAAQENAGGSTELIADSCLSTHNDQIGVYSFATGAGSVAVARVGESVVMSNAFANLSASGGSLISQGGNRIGSAGENTGFTTTEAQQ